MFNIINESLGGEKTMYVVVLYKVYNRYMYDDYTINEFWSGFALVTYARILCMCLCIFWLSLCKNLVVSEIYLCLLLAFRSVVFTDRKSTQPKIVRNFSLHFGMSMYITKACTCFEYLKRKPLS